MGGSLRSLRSVRSWIPVGVAIARRPGLWTTAIIQARRTARPGWWRRPPFVPVPGGEYLRFRTITQYGDPDHPPVAADVLNYLSWCKTQGRLHP